MIRFVLSWVLSFLLFAPTAGAAVLGEQERLLLEDEIARQGVGDVRIDLNVRVPVPGTPDQPAVDLFATVIRHDAELPTIVVATPYRREIMMMLYLPLLKHGYQLMGIDIRGTGSSHGAWISFGPEEHFDMAHVVDQWIPDQPWSDGRVGMIGPSYMAIIQLLTSGQLEVDAAGNPAHLKALFPLVSMSDAYRDIVMHGGNIDLEFIPMWLGLVDVLGLLPPMLGLGEEDFLKPSLDDIAEAQEIWKEHARALPVHLGWIMNPDNAVKNDFYETRSPMIYWPEKPERGWFFPNYPYLNEPGAIGTIPAKLPVFMIGGWFDIFTRGTLNNDQYGLANHAAGDKALVVGPWYHIDGALGLGLAGMMNGEIPARWFDSKIKGVQDPFMVKYPVLLFVDGARRWRAEKSWPLADTRVDRQAYFFSKQKAGLVPGDWFSTVNAANNFKLVESAGASDYYTRLGRIQIRKPDPVLAHDPLALHGRTTRSATRWLMGIQALKSQVSKLVLDEDIDETMPFEDERADEVGVLTFTTEPLARDMEICGPLSVTFWARTRFTNPLTQAQIDRVLAGIYEKHNIEGNLVVDSLTRPDVQWVAEVNDVFPNGRARNISSGWLAAAQRPYHPADPFAIDPEYLKDPFNPFYDHSNKNPDPIMEAKVYAYAVEIWPMDNVFKAGHRIRVSLSASDFPHLLPNLRPSRNTIVIDEQHPAGISFKSVKSSGEGEDWKWVRDPGAYLTSHSNQSGN